MKCEKHPETDAVGACVSCGRGVCPICKISYNNMIHCKECIEAGRVGGRQNYGYWPQGAGQVATTPGAAAYGQPAAYGQQAYGQPAVGAVPTTPYSYGYYPYAYYPYYNYGSYGMAKAPAQPKGVPNGGLFKIGAGGSIFLAIMSLAMGFTIMNFMFFNTRTTSPQTVILVSILLMMAMFPFGLGIFGFYKNYGSIWGLMGSVSIMISSVLYPVMLYMAILYGSSSEYYYTANFMWEFMAHLVLGIGLIMAALAINQAKRYLEVERQVQGIITFATIGLAIGGMLFTAIVGMFLVGWIATAVSLFMISVEFYHAPVPENPADEEKAKSDFFGTADAAKKPPVALTPQPTTYATNPTYEVAPTPSVQYPDPEPPRAASVETLPEEEWEVLAPPSQSVARGSARKLP
jgi:hypothetical protein